MLNDRAGDARSGRQTGETDELNGAYFLRIEGNFCDELMIHDSGDVTVSGGNLKKLETVKDRVVYSVVFYRESPGGARLSQGAVLTAFLNEKRLVLDFPEYKLTFKPEAETPAALIRRFVGP